MGAFLQKTFVSMAFMSCEAAQDSLYFKVKEQKGGE